MVRRALTTSLAPWVSGKATRGDLQRIAGLIGVPVSGTKPELVTAIQHAVKGPDQDSTSGNVADRGSLRSSNYNIVSIDMGIRNLAYAQLTTQGYNNTSECTGTSRPILQAWRRLSVGRESFDNNSEVDSTLAADTPRDEDMGLDESAQESFEPVDLAVHAYSCAKYIAQLQPSHILIERQRFRSGGHAAVQEWSLRVGVFEGMLYAVLRTLAEEGKFQGQVEAILPARVSRFWLQDFEGTQLGSQKLLREEAPVTTRVTGKEAKQAKIDLVAEMLNGAESAKADFDLSQSAEETALSFMESYQGIGRRKRHSERSKGLAWIEWRNNRLALQQQVSV